MNADGYVMVYFAEGQPFLAVVRDPSCEVVKFWQSVGEWLEQWFTDHQYLFYENRDNIEAFRRLIPCDVHGEIGCITREHWLDSPARRAVLRRMEASYDKVH